MLLSCINLIKFRKFWLFKILGMTYNLERSEYLLLVTYIVLILHEYMCWCYASCFAYVRTSALQVNEATTLDKCLRDDDRETSDHWLKVHGLRGRYSELSTLWGQVQTHSVVSVCGVAGAGKSFLAQVLHTHYSPRGWHHGSYVVNVPHPFDITDFCESLYLEIFSTPPKEGEDIFRMCWKHLEQKPCLVFIDGMRSKEDWDLIEAKLILRTSKSCIIVITREESVARHCATSDDAVCRVKGLEADAARSLFEKVRYQLMWF